MIEDFVRLVYLSLKRRRLRSWLTMIGIFIGIAAVVSLVGLGEGLRETIAGQFAFLSTDVLTVQASGLQAGPPGTGVVRPLREYMIDDLENIPGVRVSIGRMIESTKLTFEGASDFTFAASVPEDKKSKELQRVAELEIARGRMITEHDRDSIVLGGSYSDASHFSDVIAPGDKVFVHDEIFTVVGLLEKKGSFIIDHAVLMTEERMKDIYGRNDTVDLILLTVDPPEEMGLVKTRVEHYLRKERDVEVGEEDFTVESPEQNIENLNAILFAVQLFVYLLAGISLLVGGIGITNTMYTSILERTKEIGVMKSIGAQNKDIFLLFFLESGFLGIVGGIIGVLFGMGIAFLLTVAGKALLDTTLLTVSIHPLLIFGALLFSFLLGTAAGLLPALQASRLPPVEALRS